MKITLPCQLSELKQTGMSLFAVVIIDPNGHATCADGFVSDVQLALSPDEFTAQIAAISVEACLRDYHVNEKSSRLIVTH